LLVNAAPERTGAIAKLQVTQHPTPRAGTSDAALSDTIASTATVSVTKETWSDAKSGGQRTSRRAIPSSSIGAKAATSWLLVATSTERSLSFSSGHRDSSSGQDHLKRCCHRRPRECVWAGFESYPTSPKAKASYFAAFS
jgi:hypothetical protein